MLVKGATVWQYYAFQMCFFTVIYSIGHWPYLRNGWSDWHEKKRKCIDNWILDRVCDLSMWPHPGLWIFRVKFSNSYIDVKWRGSELIGCWANYVTLTFLTTPITLTLDFLGWILKYIVHVALSDFRNGRADWHATKGMKVNRMFNC